MKHYYKKLYSVALLLLFLSFNSSTTKAQLLINEGFTTVLPTGWAQQNLSTPAGTSVWFQGNTTVFPAFSGAANSYAGANFNNVSAAGDLISNWMFTPQVALTNGNVISFYTRTTTGDFPDRLELRMSTNGASVNVGAANTSVGDYTTLLLTINPTLTNSGYPTTWTKFTATISGLPAPTTGRFAFRYFVEDGGPVGNNSDFIGVDEVQYGVPCSGTPAPGNTISSVTTVCPLVPFNLSLQNATAGMGVTYVWQSATSATGPWTPIAGGINPTLTATQTAARFYRAIVTCGANSTPSTPVEVALSTCYCLAGATSTAFEKIGRVTFAGINNASTSTAGYEDFTAISGTAYIGSSMPITVTLAGGFAADQVLVWIDYNKDYDFDDAGELVYTSANGVGPHNGTINIPASVATGTTRMRVRMHDTSLGPNATPCGSSAYGQVEDYTINLVPCVPVTVTTQPTSVSVACGNNTTFNVVLAGSDPTAYWQYKTSAAATNWLDVPNAAPYSGVTTTTLAITGVTAALNGYQYRVIYKGACTGASPSSAATLTVTALVPTVNPAAPSICLGSIQQLSLTNSVAAETSVTFSATGLPAGIPDNDLVNTLDKTIAVSGIPAGSVIKNVLVKMNINHTWAGDVVANLTAPNGQTLNLFALMAGLTGSNSTANFTNTVFDSLATAPIAAAPAPRTGNFKPEAYLLTAPANFVTTTAFWGPLWGTMNGNWRLRFADAGAGDVGTVTLLEITVIYSAPGLAQGTWTATRPGTMFTDPAATIPYTGTLATSIYVRPDTIGVVNYSVSYSTPTCQSAVTTVPVTVRSLPTAFVAPVNRAICQGGTTTFTSSISNGATSAIVWQVSTDAGVTYTNLTNTAPYTGATTNTLTITNAGVALNNNRYRLSASSAPCVGTATSAAATLTVNPTPVVTLTTSTPSIFPGQVATLTAGVSPNAAATYTWLRDGAVVAGATASTYVVDVDKLGLYTVRINDVNGCIGTSAAVRISASPNNMLFIYPSPNTGQFQVRFFSQLGASPFPRTVSVFDSKGSRVYTRSYSITSSYTRLDVDLNNHPKGIYTVELTDSRGNRIKTGRVLVL